MRDYKAGDKVRVIPDKIDNSLTSAFEAFGLDINSDFVLVNEFGHTTPVKKINELNDTVAFLDTGHSSIFTNDEGQNYLRISKDLVELVQETAEPKLCDCPYEQFTLVGPGCTCGGV